MKRVKVPVFTEKGVRVENDIEGFIPPASKIKAMKTINVKAKETTFIEKKGRKR